MVVVVVVVEVVVVVVVVRDRSVRFIEVCHTLLLISLFILCYFQLKLINDKSQSFLCTQKRISVGSDERHRFLP